MLPAGFLPYRAADSAATPASPSVAIMRNYKNAKCQQITLQGNLSDVIVSQHVDELGFRVGGYALDGLEPVTDDLMEGLPLFR